ncbi:MAG: DUF6285 domain-containing protein [Marmoricola sp.]
MTTALHSYPTAPELLTALLEEWPAADASLSTYQQRVHARVLEVLAREALRGPVDEAAHRQRLTDLGYSDDAELATAIRRGEVDLTDPEIRAALLADAEARLAVVDPALVPGHHPDVR